MNALTFHCSQHGDQIAESVSIGIIPATPVRITLKCGCSWIWAKDLTWKQQLMSNGLQELGRKEAGPSRPGWSQSDVSLPQNVER